MSYPIISNEIGFALMQAGLSPFSLSTDSFQIVYEGENYIVDTECLPEIFISKRVPLDLFEYKRQNNILLLAMDWVNLRRTPVIVFRGVYSDSLMFRYYLRPESVEVFSDNLQDCFVGIERAIDAFGHACEIMIREIS